MVLAQTDHPENAFWAAHFRALGAMVNTADRPELCDFQFPALIVRDDVSVGVSTGGGSPALAGMLRQRLEDALPEDLETVCQQAAELTARLRQEIPDRQLRARALRKALEELL